MVLYQIIPYGRNGHICRALVVSIEFDSRSGQRTQGTIVTGKLAGGTGAVELDATDAADIVVGHVPAPGSDGVPLFEGNFHVERGRVSR